MRSRVALFKEISVESKSVWFVNYIIIYTGKIYKKKNLQHKCHPLFYEASEGKMLLKK